MASRPSNQARSKVQTPVHTVNSISWNSIRQLSLFSKNNSIIRIFCISGWLAVPINTDEWTSAVYGMYRCADKSLAQPGRKQARKHVRDALEFNTIETRADIKCFFFPARQGSEGNSRHSDINISLFPSWTGQGLISTPYNPEPLSNC